MALPEREVNMGLKIDNISKKFGSITALDHISIDLKQGEFLAILGSSGCGKTTLLRIIGGFINPTTGTIINNGTVFSDSTRSIPVEKRDLGMVFQSFALWPHMTVREHVAYPLQSSRHCKMTLEEKNKAVEDTIACMGLTELANRLPGELSGGQKQRVSLARAIVSHPPILLMDEPLSALDAELKISMRKEIQDIHKMTGATIVYVTHDQSEALAMADRIMIMKDGQIEQIGTPEEIYYHPQTEFSARFVSKSNLITGQWKDKITFISDSGLNLKKENVSPQLVQNGICPIRPDELDLTVNGEGIPATIVNRQFNGREIHYTVETNKRLYTIYSSIVKKYEIGEQVFIREKDNRIESAS